MFELVCFAELHPDCPFCKLQKNQLQISTLLPSSRPSRMNKLFAQTLFHPFLKSGDEIFIFQMSFSFFYFSGRFYLHQKAKKARGESICEQTAVDEKKNENILLLCI